MPKPICAGTAVVVNGSIYLINTGGHVFEYNTAKNNWQKKTSNSVPAYSLSSAVINDEIYVIGFYDSSFYKYNPSLDQWIQLYSSPFQISAGAMQGIFTIRFILQAGANMAAR